MNTLLLNPFQLSHFLRINNITLTKKKFLQVLEYIQEIGIN